MKTTRIAALAAGLGLILAGASRLTGISADARPNVRLTASNTGRAVEDATQKAILRDYTKAWQAIDDAFASNATGPLKENFVGFALDTLTQRVKDQKEHGLKTRLIDHGHKADIIFYSKDGSAVELHDLATMETQILDGDKVIHSDQAEIPYIAVLTGAEDRWKVRILESAQDKQ